MVSLGRASGNRSWWQEEEKGRKIQGIKMKYEKENKTYLVSFYAQEAIRVLMVLGVLESFKCLVLYRRAEIRLGVSLELP